MVFALPGEPGLTELCGDFKIQFHDRQGDFYWSVIQAFPVHQYFVTFFHLELILVYVRCFWCIFSWLNTTMTENRKVLNTADLDGFDKVNALL